MEGARKQRHPAREDQVLILWAGTEKSRDDTVMSRIAMSSGALFKLYIISTLNRMLSSIIYIIR